jgi:hypothetical protein
MKTLISLSNSFFCRQQLLEILSVLGTHLFVCHRQQLKHLELPSTFTSAKEDVLHGLCALSIFHLYFCNIRKAKLQQLSYEKKKKKTQGATKP